MMMPAVVLFDIDGTLIRRSGPHHRQALEEAARRVMGLEVSTQGVPVQGMLDPKIFECMLRQVGASRNAIRRAMPELVEQAQRIYEANSPGSLRRRVCPGARMLLYRLRQRGIPTGLVTGNLTRIAWRKMERAGLAHYFSFGAFAEQAADRAGLVGIALRHARRQGWLSRQTRLWLIGDHENDVRAARANAIGSVAVATGLSSREALAECEPDVLVDDLRALDVRQLVEQ
jgi:phosphoglycolate phosphatase-like HAD superfamily hydrolase